jgi:dihydrofolate reductase
MSVINIEPALAHRADLKAQIKALEARVENLDSALEEYLDATGEDMTIVGRYKIARVTVKRTALDKMRLIELGVQPGVIKEATKQSESSYVKVTELEAGQ